MGKTHTHY